MPSKPTVLLTGAAGYVASQLLLEFRDRYDLRLVDVSDRDRNGDLVEGVIVADLADPNRSLYSELFEGVDSVIHLGYRSPARVTGGDVPPIERFDIEFSNIQMANNIYRSAYDVGVERVVMASSNHAADWYEHALIHDRRMEIVSPDMVPMSDNFYGWAKASYELLGYPYASGVFGRKLEVVQIRIGAPRDVSGSRYEHESIGTESGGPGLQEFKRDLGAHLSERDLRQLVQRSIETSDIENEHGIPWLVVYGISGNTRAFWSLESARRVLGYEPEDDSEVKYADDVRRLLTGADASISGGRVGG
ncbi:MAG: NAD(P)-dependent oxidoreductase [Dehalococcoidia bacterium]